jgi:hypothetical protein
MQAGPKSQWGKVPQTLKRSGQTAALGRELP